MPSAILVHPDVWRQYKWAENWGLCPFWERGAGSPSSTMWPGQRPTTVPSVDPQFSAHLYCRQAAGCIKMPLGMEVGLSPGDFVLDGNPASPHLNGHSPQFLSNVRCVQTTGWMKTPLGTEVDLGPGHIVLDGFPALRERGTAAPHLFGPCLLWPRSPISVTAELFSYIVDD